MLRALIFTAVSQIGLIDAACLLYLQFRTVRDICRLLGYRPSFLFLTYCYLWIFANSFLFALLDESVDLTEMMPDALTLGAGKFSRKLFGAFVQGITSAALVYVTGEILKRRLLRGKKKISAKERLFIRLAGIKATMELVPSMIWDKVRDSFTGLFPKFFA